MRARAQELESTRSACRAPGPSCGSRSTAFLQAPVHASSFDARAYQQSMLLTAARRFVEQVSESVSLHTEISGGFGRGVAGSVPHEAHQVRGFEGSDASFMDIKGLVYEQVTQSSTREMAGKGERGGEERVRESVVLERRGAVCHRSFSCTRLELCASVACNAIHAV